MSVETNKALVRRSFKEDLSEGSPTVADDIFHPQFYDRTNPPGMQHGIEGHRAIVALFRTAFPDQVWNVGSLIGEDDKVVASTTMTGTHLGDFFGIPATGKAISVTGTHVLRIADGKIAEHWGHNDDLSMMRQLGVVPEM